MPTPPCTPQVTGTYRKRQRAEGVASREQAWADRHSVDGWFEVVDEPDGTFSVTWHHCDGEH